VAEKPRSRQSLLCTNVVFRVRLGKRTFLAFCQKTQNGMAVRKRRAKVIADPLSLPVPPLAALEKRNYLLPSNQQSFLLRTS